MLNELVIPADAGHGWVRSDPAYQTRRTYRNLGGQVGGSRAHCQCQRGLSNELPPSRSGSLFGKASGHDSTSSVRDEIYAGVEKDVLGGKAFGHWSDLL